MRSSLDIIIFIVSSIAMAGAVNPWTVQAQPYIQSLDCTHQDGPRSSIVCASLQSYSSSDSLTILVGSLNNNTFNDMFRVESLSFTDSDVRDIKVVYSEGCTYTLWSRYSASRDALSVYYSYICFDPSIDREGIHRSLLIEDIQGHWMDINTTVHGGDVYVVVPYRRNGWRHTELFKINRGSVMSEDVPLSSMSAYEQVTATTDSLHVGFVGPSPRTTPLTERTKANNLYIISRGITDDGWTHWRPVKIREMRGPVHFPDLYVNKEEMTFSYMMEGLDAESTVNSMTLDGVAETLMTLRGTEEIAVPRYSHSINGLTIYIKRSLLAQHARSYIMKNDRTYVSPLYDFRTRPSIVIKRGRPVLVYAGRDGEVEIRPFYTCPVSHSDPPCRRVSR